MPQIPYSGAPSVELQNNPTPTMSANTPPTAFGGATAEASQNVGKALQGAGNELFVRAQAMQDLFNHSQALEADTKYMEAAGNIHAKLSSLQGKDAVDYFTNGYHEDLKAARQGLRDGLPNDMARKLFDQSTLSTYGRTVFNGAGYAAGQNKKYAVGAATAKVFAERNAALVNPTDENAFQQHLTTTADEVRAQYALQGADQTTIDVAIQKAQSNLWYDRIAGLARQQPYEAQKILDRAVKDGTINGEDVGKVTQIVRDAMHTVGARQIASKVNDGSDLSWGAKPVSIASAKQAIGTYESQNNYQTLGPEVFAKDGSSRGRALGRYQVMPENLPDWLKQSGLPTMTPREFLNSPSAQDKVFETIFGGYMERYGSFNAATKAWFTGDPNAPDTANDKYHTVAEYLGATNRTLANNASLADKVSRGRMMADSQSPNDPLLADYTESQIISTHNRQIAVNRDDTWNNRQTVVGGLVGGGQNGKLPTTVEELKQISPEIEAAWQKLPNTIKQQYMGVLARNAKGDTAMTEDKLRTYQELKGMAQTNPAEFLDKDIISMDLPLRERKELINLQQSKKANAEADPRVSHALGILRPTLEAAGINRQNKESLNRFTGALQTQIEAYSAENKKQPDAKAIQEIGQRLLRETVTSRGWLWDSKSQVFNVEVPTAERKSIVDAYTSRFGFPPTDDLIQRAYAASVYQKLYGAGLKRAPAAQSATPSPPISR